MQKKMYIVLLLNDNLKVLEKYPEKKGSYLQKVRLFEAATAVTGTEILKWVKDGHSSPVIVEVEDWV
jgi:hypothetical protein